MLQDTIVEEIRGVRDRYAKQFKYNLLEIYKDLKTQEAKSDLRFVSLPAKPAKHVNAKDKDNLSGVVGVANQSLQPTANRVR